MARQFASLDHLSGGRAAWNVVTSWDAFTDENFRRGGFLPQQARYERARTFLQTTWQLFDSWRGDEIVADQASGQFLSKANAGAFEHHDAHFDISGQFNVPRSPQGRPVIFQAGDSDAGREFAASSADAIFSRHGTLAEGQAFYKDVKGRLDVHRIPGHRRRGDPHLGPGGRQRRVHPRPAHHIGRARRVRRHGGAAAAGTRRLPVRVRGHRTALSTVEEFGLIDALHPGRLDLGLGRSGGRPRQSEPALVGAPGRM